MPTINLKDFYPWCTQNEFVEITEDMLEAMKAADRQEAAYARRTRYHKGYYSLDSHTWLENYILLRPETPDEIFERAVTLDQLHTALGRLTETERRRIRAYYFDGLNGRQIAEREGVCSRSIYLSLNTAMKKLARYRPELG